MIFKRRDAICIEKNGVDMWIYNGVDDSEQAAVAYQETRVGHCEEFRHNKSAFIYYIIEGSGHWIIDGIAFEVAASDVVIIPPGIKFYYTGALKHVCITAPAWQPQHEESIRIVDLESET